ncbi:Rap1a/Tai family immunity protein [Pantoea stewartii]|uniref:Rap1a immunity protein domain-containing protein n=1 Tax=Pantoea stewartii TaxID=66269 RepID=A0AB34VJI0_9GAMM|nr:Rap1a/Tai family immunity protein [Pantoea stewartii]KTS71904.1 hypothetical protein RSA30_17110 [Pantoea stewartii]KTT00358.1 hypothetical protein RSA13_02870 [Pantoea stewartii]KTT09187.1 hypothetical protein RSA36_04545 [Pantoea stewartii]
MLKSLLVTILLCVSYCSNATMITGERLLDLAIAYQNAVGRDPSVDNQVKGSAYMGFVNGVTDSFDGKLFCIPNGEKASKLYDYTINFIVNNPRLLKKDGSEIVILALRKSYPCR